MKYSPVILTDEQKVRVDKAIKDYISGTETGVKGVRVLWVGKNVLLVQHKPCSFSSGRGVTNYSTGWVDLLEFEQNLTLSNSWSKNRIEMVHDGKLTKESFQKIVEEAQIFDSNYDKKKTEKKERQEENDRREEEQEKEWRKNLSQLAGFLGGTIDYNFDVINVNGLRICIRREENGSLSGDFVFKATADSILDLAEILEPFAKLTTDEKVKTCLKKDR